MTDVLARVEAVLAAATEGPWRKTAIRGKRDGYVRGVSHTVADMRYRNGEQDATFIAFAHNTYPEALAVVRAARLLDDGWMATEEGDNVRMRYASDLPARLLTLREAVAAYLAKAQELVP